MALVPFRYTNPYTDTLRLPERLFDVKVGEETTVTLRIQQHYEEDGKGGTKLGFGASVYDAAVALAKYIEQNTYLVRGKRVLELGAGLGMTSIAVKLVGASSVIVTDGDDELLEEKTRKNIQLNLGEKCLQEGNISVERLYWGHKEDIEKLRHKQDIVIAADVAALPYENAYKDLLSTCEELCQAHYTEDTSGNSNSGERLPDMILASRRRHYTEQKFFKSFEQSFIIEKVPREHMHPDFQAESLEILKCWLKR